MSNILLSNVVAMGIVSFTYDPAQQLTVDTDEDTVTIPGLKVGDFVSVNKPTHTDGVGLTDARVTADDTLSVTWVNPTAGTVDPGSETYLLFWARPDSAKNSVQA